MSDLVPIDPPASTPTAARAYAVPHQGRIIGQVVLTIATRPRGATAVRQWWATATVPEARALPRPFTTAEHAAAALRFQHDHPPNAPRTPPRFDTTAESIRAARTAGGTTAALWLAASLVVHHITEIEANRTANPPALWRELARITGWLRLAMSAEPNASSPPGVVDYRHSRNELDGLD